MADHYYRRRGHVSPVISLPAFHPSIIEKRALTYFIHGVQRTGFQPQVSLSFPCGSGVNIIVLPAATQYSPSALVYYPQGARLTSNYPLLSLYHLTTPHPNLLSLLRSIIGWVSPCQDQN